MDYILKRSLIKISILILFIFIFVFFIIIFNITQTKRTNTIVKNPTTMLQCTGIGYLSDLVPTIEEDTICVLKIKNKTSKPIIYFRGKYLVNNNYCNFNLTLSSLPANLPSELLPNEEYLYFPPIKLKRKGLFGKQTEVKTDPFLLPMNGDPQVLLKDSKYWLSFFKFILGAIGNNYKDKYFLQLEFYNKAKKNLRTPQSNEYIITMLEFSDGTIVEDNQ